MKSFEEIFKESDKVLRRNLRVELGSLYRDYLDDVQREEARAKAEEQIEEYCG